MEYRILGPLEVACDGNPLDLGGRKQRSLLALLVINANRVVTTERILEELWGDKAAGKENALWVHISRLRSILEPDRNQPTVLVTRDHGYSLIVEPDSVDVFRFELAATSGRSGMKDDPESASEILSEGLSLWRGDFLEDFRYEEFARVESNRLEEMRVSAVEDRLDADLRRGKSGELMGELDALCEAYPLRERPVSLRMLALYRAGRQADALRSFNRFQRTLGEDLGIDPSPELCRLEEQILLHDSRLQAPTPRRATAILSANVTNPFKGLRAFREADSDVFFGRDRLIADVIRRLAHRQRLVTLVGPSGSGKSSIVRAGVIAALRKDAIPDSGQWLIAQMVPGSHPFAELEAALLRSAFDAPDSLAHQLSGDEAGILRAALRILPEDTSKILIVIDQFEELFTVVDDESIRVRFLEGITEAIDDPHERVMVLLTLRADFYGQPLQYPAFGGRIADGVVNVVPMTPDELEQAAHEPAAQVGVSFEPSLLASLLSDVVGRPGALPLFQYTLSELFDRQVGSVLNLDVYQTIGGLRGALSRRADDSFSELTKQQQEAARQLFLRLVTITDTYEWSRRRVPASEIIALDIDTVRLQAVIDMYGSARLLTFDRDEVSGSPTVEVAHEALLTEWDRLREWIDDAQNDVRRQGRLAVAAVDWQSAERDPDYLLTGSRLAEFAEWALHSTLALTADERAFLDASLAESHARVAAERERVARESDLDRRSNRRLRGMAVAIAVLGLALIILVVTLEPPERTSPTESESGLSAESPSGSAYERWAGTVEAMVVAASERRFDAYLALFSESAQILGTPFAPTEEAFVAADVNWAFAGDPDDSCGLGDGGDLTCYSMSRSDSFHGAGGLAIHSDFTFTFDSAGLITSIDVDRSLRARYTAPFGQQGLNQYAAFAEAFANWLSDAHPEIAASLAPPLSNGMASAADMPIALEYVTEFVAQSDLYPQQPSGAG